MSFLLRFESVSSPETPEQAIRWLVDTGRRLGLGVVANVNGFEAFAWPGEADAVVVKRWQDARRAGDGRSVRERGKR